jgi:hypothetical protein
MKNKKLKKAAALIAITILILVVGAAFYNSITPLSLGLHSKVNRSFLSGDAIHRYDPVAYFTENKAIPGNENLLYGWNDAIWYFSSQENLDLFKSDPEKFAPQFGGYCVLAVSKGFTSDSDPVEFIIIDEKLYMCSDSGIRDELQSDSEEILGKAHENWK